ncbi:MAG: PH domain-containing protein [Pirellulales bacterium]|nr:PH domain-containing protein [Pirellulales bacterium]
MTPPPSGFVSPDLRESTVMTVWPSIGTFVTGRLVGRFCEDRLGWGFFTLGKLGAIVSIPWSLVLYFWLRMPYVCRRYVLTNRRVIVRHGLRPVDRKWIDLDEFQTVSVEVLPGQEWLHAGEVVFRSGQRELLRLSGVLRPEVFAQVCRSTRQAQLSVRQVLQEQMAAAE